MSDVFSIEKTDIAENPFAIFKEWFNEASSNKSVVDATAMTLATSSKNGRPSARVVLLKEFNEKGFTFFTNEKSSKGRNISQNPQAEVCFYWEPLGKQIRIYGKIEKVTSEESDAYFASRHLNSRIGACVSKQSSELESYQTLKDEFEKFSQENPSPKRPEHWNGFRIIPLEFEFWQNGNFRLHLRHKFKLVSDQPSSKHKFKNDIKTEEESNFWQHTLLYP